jgi:hypothetical protein
MNVEWAAWVQAGTAVIVAGVTVWYAYLTHRLLQAQVEPSVDLWIPHDRVGARVYNTGSHDVVDVRVDVEVVVYEHGRRLGGSVPPPWQPGVDRLHSWKRVRRGEVRDVDLTVDAKNAVAYAGTPTRNEEPGGAATSRRAALLLHVVYHRAIDHRRFRFTRTALLVFNGETHEVHHLMDQDAMHYPSMAEERERAA